MFLFMRTMQKLNGETRGTVAIKGHHLKALSIEIDLANSGHSTGLN
jgi:hypothetical protein